MELLQKFSAVEIQANHRITEMDKDYCERHQKAYEATISSFQELAFFWEDMNKAQQKLFGDSTAPNYLVSEKGPTISQGLIEEHIKELHSKFIVSLIDYFYSTYHISVDTSEILYALLPQEPEEYWKRGYLDLCKQYHQQMLALVVSYQDVVDQIILQMDGSSFSERAFHELYVKCHNAAWCAGTQMPRFERRRDTICFTGYFCSRKCWSEDAWEVQDDMREILRGLAHFETGSYRVYPTNFTPLLTHEVLKESVVEFPTCEKVKQMKLFKNNRVDLKFHSPQFAEQFVNKYLGAVS